jgi:uncharacterized protein
MVEPLLRSLTLTVTERCNLCCAYCHVPTERGTVMDDAVIDAAVDLLARHGDEEPTLSFYGGEPLLALDGVRRAVARARKDEKRRLRVLTPTNGLLLEGEALGWVREEGVDVAVSIDADEGATERRFADGRPATPRLLPLLEGVTALHPGARVYARMTVTPANVDRLAASVRALAARGFHRVLYQPAFEEAWDEAAVAAWGREHAAIGAWLRELAERGETAPDVPAYRAVEQRLARGLRRSSCGAGHHLAAVSADGGLYPCYRLVFRGDDPGCKLGDVREGFTNHAAVDRFAAFHPYAMQPEQGSCDDCASADGCTHACPALGYERFGDPRRVPAVACALARAQVEAVRPFALPRRRAKRFPPLGWAAAVIASAAVISACGPTIAGGICPTGGGGATGGGGTDAGIEDASGGGLCPVYVDGGGGAGGDLGGGICPVQVDAGGGLCDVGPADAGPDGYYGGGLC